MKNKTLKYSLFTILVLIFAALFYIIPFNNETTKPQPHFEELGTFNNPEIAYEECQKILKDLSQTINISLKEKVKK